MLGSTNRNAVRPVNALLNSTYDLLSADVQIDAVAEGYDLRRGMMRHDRNERCAYAWVFDQMELLRPAVGAAVLKLVLSTKWRGSDFTVRSDGVCRLTPQLAKVVAQEIAPRLFQR